MAKTTEELLAELLQRDLDREAAAQKAADAAAKAEEESKFVSKSDFEAAFASFGEQVAAKIVEEVAKAMPVARPEGAGRVGETPASDEIEDPVAYIAQKAASERTDEDKELAWALTKAAIKFAE